MSSSFRSPACPACSSRKHLQPQWLVPPKRPTYNRSLRERIPGADPLETFQDWRTSLSMAWNQPGGQNNNPWGSRRPGNGGGGSNLDERMKDWQRRFESLFRPGGKGEGGALFITVLLLILTLWLFSGFFQVK